MRLPVFILQIERAASKKQTPFSVWYFASVQRIAIGMSGLKEADAFQRLVWQIR